MSGDPLANGRLLVLTYHRVAEPPPGSPLRGLYVTPAQFAWQLAQLARGGARVLTLRDLATEPDDAAGGHRPGAPRVVLTFDDGTVDIFQHAYPLLRWFGFPAVIFPVVDDIGKSRVVWAHSADPSPVDLLSAGQLAAMAEDGFEIGAHMLHHVPATSLPRQVLLEEMSDARRRLAALLGGEVFSVAYPYGDYDERVVRAAAAAGFRYGVTTDPGMVQDRGPLQLRRMAVKGTRWYHRLQYLALLRRHLRIAAS
ncbi:MAG: polysaccharide deacetylase family protein [Candidatus Lambdaproteobacteria bacterium]|nr:polysaccharide deacetylase family protein [Candidatus Lambdaproteobacteria bacterium]